MMIRTTDDYDGRMRIMMRTTIMRTTIMMRTTRMRTNYDTQDHSMI